ncbi:MAG: nucleotidyltransferase domain-containing protein [Chloroflexota bacterium]|nr:nucleotidyltransferase domain-containing protein [Chloroflexota bacterium]
MCSAEGPRGAWSEAGFDGLPLLEIAAAYGALPGVVAVAVAGSLAAGTADPASDVDLYVYAPQPPLIPLRAEIAARFARVSEVGSTVWEPGDEWLDAQTERHIDVIYRTPAWIEDQLARVLVRHEASVGYSTCFWHNVLHSLPMVDPAGWYARLQDGARQPYPAALQRAIIAKNHPILRRALSSYLRQIERAVARDDAVSVQHRVTALLASYFDILFAVNELPHPGEKRQLHFALERCHKLPPDMAAALTSLLSTPAAPATPVIVDRANALLDGLDVLLAAEGLLM